jgi:hypothetical protein
MFLAAVLAIPASLAGGATMPTPTVGLTGPATTYVGYPLELTATVADPAAPGETVTLQRYSGLVWKDVGTATLDALSQTTFTVTPTSTTSVRYRVQIDASPEHAAATSAAFKVTPVLKVPVVTLTGPESVVVNTAATLTASVTDPTAVGETITLQKFGGLAWGKAAEAVLGANSQATCSGTPTAITSTRCPVTIAKTSLHAAETSEEYVLTSTDVPPPPPPYCGGTAPAKTGGGSYTCSFGDDFDGTALDTTKWLVAETAFSGQPVSNAYCFVNDPDNVSVSGGQIHLSARFEPTPFTCQKPLGQFTTQVSSAAVTTKGRFNQAYGYFEFRAKFPDLDVAGAHSGLWMNPDELTYGAWPKSGEIDVAERQSLKGDHVDASVHYDGEEADLFTQDCVVPGAGTGFHTYAVEWSTSGTTRFYYDGALCFVHAPAPAPPLTAPQPFDKPFNLILQQIFGGGWNAPTAQTPDVVTMDVDWVRVWK